MDSPTRDLCCNLMSRYLVDKSSIKGTICDSVRSLGYFTVSSAFIKPKYYVNIPNDGVIDTLRFHMCRDSFLKPYSDKYVLTQLLTRAF